ncbi:type II toxin-antitoxin system prevent-host-death family antitoxin [Roseovarius pacificus]|uniref:type II toxin-antitoxin system prevent-host-death family antitoxin n=1 Tax=Roseovarius pacificus TaxID=337701 RepID=UPI000A06FAE7
MTGSCQRSADVHTGQQPQTAQKPGRLSGSRHGDHLTITRHGREQVALIPAADLHRLEEVEPETSGEADG